MHSGAPGAPLPFPDRGHREQEARGGGGGGGLGEGWAQKEAGTHAQCIKAQALQETGR